MNAHNEVGRPDAPRGSRDWAVWYAGEIWGLYGEARTSVGCLEGNLRSLKKFEAHKLCAQANGKPFRSWQHFCDTRRPFGLGIGYELAEAILAEENMGKKITAVKAEIEASSHERTRAAAANPETGKVLPRGGDQKSEQSKSMSKLDIDTQAERAQQNGIGRQTQIKLDALARQAPELLEQVKEGRLSAHAAAIEAGIVKVPSNLEKAKKAALKLTEEELVEFQDWLVSCGFGGPDHKT